MNNNSYWIAYCILQEYKDQRREEESLYDLEKWLEEKVKIIYKEK